MSVCNNTRLQGVLLLVIIGLMFLPIPMDTLWWREFFNTGHTFFFMLFAYLLARQLSSKKILPQGVVTYLVVLLTVLLLGIAIEGIQGFVGREMSWSDLQNDLIGALAGLAFYHARRLGSAGSGRQAVLAVVFASSMLLSGSYSFVRLSWHYFQRDNALPVLADFGEDWSNSFVRYNKVILLSDVKDKRGMYVFEFLPGRYPGINIIEPEADWSQYQRLRFRIFSTYKEKIIFVLRVHDRDHNREYADRFNTRLTVSPGMNDISLDVARIEKGMLERQLDVENIAGLTLFLMKLERRHIFEISELYLE